MFLITILILILIILLISFIFLFIFSFLFFILLGFPNYQKYNMFLLNTICMSNNRYSKNIGTLGNPGFVTVGYQISKKYIFFIKTKFIKPFTYLKYKYIIMIDYKRINYFYKKFGTLFLLNIL